MVPEGVRTRLCWLVPSDQPSVRDGGSLGFLQGLRAFLATDFHDLTADRDRDRVRIQRAVASRATFLNHEIVLLNHRNFDEGRDHLEGIGRYQDL